MILVPWFLSPAVCIERISPHLTLMEFSEFSAQHFNFGISFNTIFSPITINMLISPLQVTLSWPLIPSFRINSFGEFAQLFCSSTHRPKSCLSVTAPTDIAACQGNIQGNGLAVWHLDFLVFSKILLQFLVNELYVKHIYQNYYFLCRLKLFSGRIIFISLQSN